MDQDWQDARREFLQELVQQGFTDAEAEDAVAHVEEEEALRYEGEQQGLDPEELRARGGWFERHPVTGVPRWQPEDAAVFAEHHGRVTDEGVVPVPSFEDRMFFGETALKKPRTGYWQDKMDEFDEEDKV